jgi:hypothetical protein
MSNEANAAALLAILRPRVDPEELTGFYEGNFCPEGTKFLAYTFVPLADVDLYPIARDEYVMIFPQERDRFLVGAIVQHTTLWYRLE